MFERYTDRARRAVTLAQEEAQLLKQNWIGTEHLLLGLMSEGQGTAWQALDRLGFSLEDARNAVREITGEGSDEPRGHIPFTSRSKKVLERSLRESLMLGHNYIGTEHILLGIVREGEDDDVDVAAQVLRRFCSLAHIRQAVLALLSGAYEASVSSVSAKPVLPHADIKQTQTPLYSVRCHDCGEAIQSALGLPFGDVRRAEKANEEHLCTPRRLRLMEERLAALEAPAEVEQSA